MLLTDAFLARLAPLEAEGRYSVMTEEIQHWLEDAMDEGRIERAQIYADGDLAALVARLDDAQGEYECYWHTIRWLDQMDPAACDARWHEAMARACLYTGQLRRARQLAARGAQLGSAGAERFAVILEAHFGRRERALELLDAAFARRGEDAALAGLRAGVLAGAPLEQLMLTAFPRREKTIRALTPGFVTDGEGLGRVQAALDATDWAFEEPWCACRIPHEEGTLAVRLCMNEAWASKLDPGWLKELRAALPRLDAAARPLVRRRWPGVEPRLEEILLERGGGAKLGYHVGRCDEEPLYAYAPVGPTLEAPAALSDERWPAVWFDPPPEPFSLPLPPSPGYTPAQQEALARHIGAWLGPVRRVLPGGADGVQVLVIDPRPGREYYTLVTFGMGARPMAVPPDLENQGLERAELMVLLPPDWKLDEERECWRWPLRWLRLLARMPAEQDTWLGWGHTVPNGRPFAPDTLLSGIMLVDPLDAPEPAAICPLPGGEKVNFYQLLPLYADEMDLKLEQDADGLLDALEDKGLLDPPWIDPARPPAVGAGEAAPDPALARQLEELDRRADDAGIAALLEPLVQTAQSPRLTGILARSLNNLGRYERALTLLEGCAEAGRRDPLWQFRMGFSCYYTGRLARALACFEEADRMAPGDGDTETYLRWCRAALDEPVRLEPFTRRAARFWDAFCAAAPALEAEARERGCEAVRGQMKQLLALCFADPDFRLEARDGALRLTVEWEQTPHRRWLLAVWRALAPAQLDGRWRFPVPDAPDEYAGYRRLPGGDAEPRLADVIAGTTCLPALVREFEAGQGAIADAALAEGAVCGFLFYAHPAGEQDPVGLRAALEEQLARQGAHKVCVLGGAVGAKTSCIDLLTPDLNAMLECARQLLAPLDSPVKGFRVFRAGSGTVDLSGPVPRYLGREPRETELN